MPGFVPCRRDRPGDRRGGGLCTFISNHLNATELDELSEPELESKRFLVRPNRLLGGIIKMGVEISFDDDIPVPPHM